ncbi:alpha/beta hydrolase [Streptomycetaceae bacterium NBC_01309]
MNPRLPRTRRRTGAFLVTAALLLGTGAAVAPVSAAPTHHPSGPKPTIVLVHGAFADASGWYPTITRLQKAGYTVIAPANPLRDLNGDSAYVSSVLDTIEGPVVLVGHSYGGEVITNAARGHDNVKALVYVAAFAPDQGETALRLAGQFPGSKLPESLIVRDYPLPEGGPGKDGYIDPAKFREVFAGDLSASEARQMAAAQRPASVFGLDTPSGVPAWKSLPSWYVIPTADNVIPAAAQRFMADRADSRTVEVKGSSHVVMMSRPDAVVRQILAADRATRR